MNREDCAPQVENSTAAKLSIDNSGPCDLSRSSSPVLGIASAADARMETELSLQQHSSVYRQPILDGIWRVASLLDRNPHSATRGSFSRTHWAWKFEDFPFPRMQESVYALCCLYDLPGPDNPFFQSVSVAKWIRWGFQYWCSQRHANGAFDEAYPNEQCLAATAFTTFYLGQAYLLFSDRLDADLRSGLTETFAAAGSWLCQNDEKHACISNHLAVAASALQLVAQICERPEFAERARYFLNRILQNQSDEGWMKEYDGADIGYGTHCFFYLAVYWQLTGCEQTLTALRQFANFLKYFIHPDGTIGGEYASRNTEFYYPAGFEILASHCPASASIARHQRTAIRQRSVCGVWCMDAFNYLPMYNNLLFAWNAAHALDEAEPLPYQSPPFRQYFANCGLWVVNEHRFYSIVGLSKGGTVSIFNKRTGELTARHAGHTWSHRNSTYTCQDQTSAPQAIFSPDGTEVTIQVPWKKLNVPVFNSWLFLAFRVFTLTLGKLPAVSVWLKNLLVKVLIRRKSRPAIRHTRKLSVTESGILVSDEIHLPARSGRVQPIEQFTSIHMGSSMYCDARSLKSSTSEFEFPSDRVLELRGVLSLDGTFWIESNTQGCVESAA